MHDFHLQGHEVVQQHLFIDCRTPQPKKKHRYRHQDYHSSMFVAIYTKKRKFSIRTLLFLCRQRASYMRNQITHVSKCVGGSLCRFSYLKTFWGKMGKVTGKNYRGVATTLFGCMGVKVEIIWWPCQKYIFEIMKEQKWRKIQLHHRYQATHQNT